MRHMVSHLPGIRGPVPKFFTNASTSVTASNPSRATLTRSHDWRYDYETDQPSLNLAHYGRLTSSSVTQTLDTALAYTQMLSLIKSSLSSSKS